MIAATDFIAAFPEFANGVTYPLSQLDFWISQGYAQLNSWLFGQDIDIAVMLFAAHNVVLSARAAQSNNQGQIVGNVQGPMASKTIGPLSISYSGATNIAGAGAWNNTTYGQRLFMMMRSFSAGPKYVGPSRNRFPGWFR